MSSPAISGARSHLEEVGGGEERGQRLPLGDRVGASACWRARATSSGETARSWSQSGKRLTASAGTPRSNFRLADVPLFNLIWLPGRRAAP
jgi:hypothetical protein